MLAGVFVGLLVWAVCGGLLKVLPDPIAFYLTAFAFIFGCGALPLLSCERHLGGAERVAIACALGLAVASSLLCLLAVARIAFVFPPCAFAASGAVAARWWFARGADRQPAGDGRWYVLVALVVFGIAAWISAGRITITGDGLSIFGDYETFDLTYYAAIASELGRTAVIPPLSPFYAGHRIIYSYFPLMLLAAVHNATGVSTTRVFLALGWPLYTSVAAASMFAFCRRLGSLQFAVWSTLLVFTGSTLAYVAAWLWPEMVRYDPLIWSSMFLGPSAEWVYFNPWAPTLAVAAVGLYALTRLDDLQGWTWVAIASFCFGSLFMFKSFSFPVVVAALAIAAGVAAARRDRIAVRIAAVTAGAVAWAVPWLLAVLPYNQVENRGAQVTVSWLSLVRRMLLKTDLTGTIEGWLSHVISGDPEAWQILSIATVLFLIGGLGARWIGAVPLWRAAIGQEPMRRWTPLAWIVIVGVGSSFAFAVAPFPNSIQTYLFALFAMWPFAVHTVWPPNARPSAGRWAATAILVCLSVPSTVHYIRAAHDAAKGPPLTALGAGDFQVIRALRRADETRTMMLHSNPVWPSLYAIESGRRVALAWSSYVEGDGNPEIDAQLAEIARFFGSPDAAGTADLSLLRRFHITHVIERVASDHLHPDVVQQLRLVAGTPAVRLYEVPEALSR